MFQLWQWLQSAFSNYEIRWGTGAEMSVFLLTTRLDHLNPSNIPPVSIRNQRIHHPIWRPDHHMISSLMLQHRHVSLQELPWPPQHSKSRKTLQNSSETYAAVAAAAAGAVAATAVAGCARAVTEPISLRLASRRWRHLPISHCLEE